MKVCQFNFNNEVDSFEIHVEDDNRVIIPGENGPLAEYASVQQLAEIYAQARDVKPENLKNWVLLKNGSVYSFVLRAGTAGVDISEVEEQLEQVFQNLEGTYHPLSIARAKEEIMADGTADLVNALVHCSETDVAKDIYNAMQPFITDTGRIAENNVEEAEDTRSDLEKYLDDMEVLPGTFELLSVIVGLPVTSEKADLLAALQANVALSNVDILNTICKNAINDVINDGIGVNNEIDAITVLTQTAVGVKDDEIKNRLSVAARMAGRDKINLSVDIVGKSHIRHTAKMIAVSELEDIDIFVRDNVPYIVQFSDTVDEELQAEHAAEAAQLAEAEETEPWDEDEPEDDPYDDDYEDASDY